MPKRREPSRRTQAERRASTRAKLLDAVLEELVAGGYHDLTTPAICARAGVSQGALFKHFATKSALLAAATEHLFTALRAGYAERFAAVDARRDPIRKGIDLLWVVFEDPRLRAAYDLYTAARTDAELRASLDPVVREHAESLHELARALFDDLPTERKERLRDAVDLAILALQGLALNEMAHHEPDARERALRVLSSVAEHLLATPEGKR